MASSIAAASAERCDNFRRTEGTFRQ